MFNGISDVIQECIMLKNIIDIIMDSLTVLKVHS